MVGCVVEPGRNRLASRTILGVLSGQPARHFEVRVRAGKGATPCRQMGAREGEQHPVNEHNGRRRALDVEEHDPDALIGEPDGHMPPSVGGIYAGPKQSG